MLVRLLIALLLCPSVVFGNPGNLPEVAFNSGVDMSSLVSMVEVFSLESGELQKSLVPREQVRGCYDQYFYTAMNRLYTSQKAQVLHEVELCRNRLEEGNIYSRHVRTKDFNCRGDRFHPSDRNKARLKHAFENKDGKLAIHLSLDYKIKCSGCLYEEGEQQMRSMINFCKDESIKFFAKYNIDLKLNLNFRPYGEKFYDADGEWIRSVYSHDNADWLFETPERRYGVLTIFPDTHEYTRMNPYDCPRSSFMGPRVCNNPNVCKDFLYSLASRLGIDHTTPYNENGCYERIPSEQRQDANAITSYYNHDASWEDDLELRPEDVGNLFRGICRP